MKLCGGHSTLIPGVYAIGRHRFFGSPHQRRTNRHFSIRHQFICKRRKKDVVCSSGAHAPKDTSSTTNAIDYALAQGTYLFLTGLLGAFGLTLVTIAPIVAEKGYGFFLIPLSEVLLRSVGAMLIPAAAICYCMQSAIAANRLDSSTYKRLAFVLATTMNLVIVARSWSLYEGIAINTIGVWLTTLAQLLPTVAFLKLYGVSTLEGVVPGIISGVSSLFKSESVSSGIYSTLTALTMIYGLFAFCFPQRMATFMFAIPTDAYSRLMMMVFGAMIILISTICFTLKDAADRNRLGFTTFKTLNASVSLASISNFISFWYVCNKACRVAKTAGLEAFHMMKITGGAFNMGLFLFLALYCSYNAVMAKKY
eukprot:g6511.t1